MISRHSRKIHQTHDVSFAYNTKKTKFKTPGKPLCLLIILLIICNLITLHFLNKSVQRTSSMNCSINESNKINKQIINIQMNNQNQDDETKIKKIKKNIKEIPHTAQKYGFKNLNPSAPYSHLPYLPHNIDGKYINSNPYSINDDGFINKIKYHFSHNNINNDNDNKVKDNEKLKWKSIQKDNKYIIQKHLLKPETSITMEDELNRNNIISSKELWKLQETKTNNNEMLCSNTIEYLFNNSIYILHQMKGRNFIERMICPDFARAGWRHVHYVPFIFGNHCEPWWARDAIFIISRLLNKNMIGLEWGSGVSTIWLSMFTHYIIAKEHNKEWVQGLNQIISQLNISNVMVTFERLGRRYVEFDYAGNFANNPGNRIWKPGVIDYISIDGRLRYESTEWALKWIKPHGGIIIFDNSDRKDETNHYTQRNATDWIPKHWLRYDSTYFKQHIKPIGNKQWLNNSRTTIWITRDKNCINKQKYYSSWNENDHKKFVDESEIYENNKIENINIISNDDGIKQKKIIKQQILDKQNDESDDEDDSVQLNFKPF